MRFRTNPFSPNFRKHLVPTYLSFSSSPKYSSSHMYSFKFRKQRTKLSTKFLFNSGGTRWYSRNEILWSGCVKWYILFYIKNCVGDWYEEHIIVWMYSREPSDSFHCRFAINRTSYITNNLKLTDYQAKLNLKLDFDWAVTNCKNCIWIERNLVEIIIKRHWSNSIFLPLY